MQNRSNCAALASIAATGLAAVLLLAPSIARAGSSPGGVVISAPTFSAAAGSTGSFEVDITNTAAGPGPDVAGYTIDLAGNADITITNITDTGTVNPYIFGPSSPDFFAVPLSNSEFIAGDTDTTTNGPDFYTAVNGGDFYGLVTVDYTIANGATGVIPLAFAALGTSLSDNSTPLADAIPFATVDGQITISGSVVSGTPLPASAAAGLALLACLAGASAIGYYRRQRLTARD
jgi:hypothetical protein